MKSFKKQTKLKMELKLPAIFITILRIYTILCLLLCFCTDCYFLSKNTHWSIHTGYKPEYWYINLDFYINMGVLCWLFLAIFFTVVEILAMVDVKIFENFDHGIIKPIVYLVMGFGILGICGDLGIATGILQIIAAAVWLVLAILTMI